MTVFIVKQVKDYEYGCRDIEAVFEKYEDAEEYIKRTNNQREIIFWNGSKEMKYIISKYEVL